MPPIGRFRAVCIAELQCGLRAGLGIVRDELLQALDIPCQVPTEVPWSFYLRMKRVRGQRAEHPGGFGSAHHRKTQRGRDGQPQVVLASARNGTDRQQQGCIQQVYRTRRADCFVSGPTSVGCFRGNTEAAAAAAVADEPLNSHRPAHLASMYTRSFRWLLSHLRPSILHR